MKSKKILGLLLVVTLLSATVFGSVSVSAAGGETNVTQKSYLPPVKTLFVDDDFENRTVDALASAQPSNAAYQYPIGSRSGTGIKIAQESDEAANKYAIYNNGWQTVECDSENLANANSLVVSFRTLISAGTGIVKIRFSSTGPAIFFQKLSNGKIQIKSYKSSSAADDKAINTVTVSGNGTDWVDCSVVFEKTREGLVRIKSLFVNGEKIKEDPEANMTLYDGCSWISAKNVGIQATAAKTQIDDILVYEPYDVYMKDANIADKSVTIVNDSDAEVSGKVFLALYDENKNLVYATEYTGEVKVPANGSLPVVLTDEIDVPNAKSAKIFFWDKGSLAPHCSAQEIDLSLIS